MKLRALEPEDLSVLYEIENDVDVWEHSSTTTPVSMYTLRQYIASCKNDLFEDGLLRLAVEADGELVGLVDLTDFSPLHRRAEVGIVIRKAFRGRGFGREALQQLADYARRVAGLHQLYAVVSALNNPALSLFAKSGYQEAHHLKDWLCSATGETHDATLFQCFLP